MMIVRILTILLALSVLPVIADDTAPGPGENKIVQYEVKGGGMLANASVDWGKYTRVLLDQPATVEFREDWKKDQERLNNNMVTGRDLAQIRSWTSKMLQEVLSEKISGLEAYSLAEAGGSDVLRFTPRITKLDIHAPGNTQVIVGNVLVDGKGSLVLVMEISDSISGELLASAWRLEVDPDKGFMATATEAGNKTAFRRLMENWATWLFAMLDHVQTRNAVEGS